MSIMRRLFGGGTAKVHPMAGEPQSSNQGRLAQGVAGPLAVTPSSLTRRQHSAVANEAAALGADRTARRSAHRALANDAAAAGTDRLARRGAHQAVAAEAAKVGLAKRQQNAATQIQALARGKGARQTAPGQHMQEYKDLRSDDSAVRNKAESAVEQREIAAMADRMNTGSGTSYKHSAAGLGISLKQSMRYVGKSFYGPDLGIEKAYQRTEKARTLARQQRTAPQTAEESQAQQHSDRSLAAEMALSGTSWKHGLDGAAISAQQGLRRMGSYLPGWGQRLENKRQAVEKARALARDPDQATQKLIGEKRDERFNTELKNQIAYSGVGSEIATAASMTSSLVQSQLGFTKKFRRRQMEALTTKFRARMAVSDPDASTQQMMADHKTRRFDTALGRSNPETGLMGSLSNAQHQASMFFYREAAMMSHHYGYKRGADYYNQRRREAEEIHTMANSRMAQRLNDRHLRRNQTAIIHEGRGDNLDVASGVVKTSANVASKGVRVAADAHGVPAGAVVEASTQATLELGAAGLSHLAAGEHDQAQSAYINSPKPEKGGQDAMMDYSKAILEDVKAGDSRRVRDQTAVGAVKKGARKAVDLSHQSKFAKSVEGTAVDVASSQALEHLRESKSLTLDRAYALRGRTLQKAVKHEAADVIAAKFKANRYRKSPEGQRVQAHLETARHERATATKIKASLDKLT